MTFKAALKSMRLRTLPLSLSGIVMGIAMASGKGLVNVPTVIFLILTTCSLQVLSNLSNELGDTLSGTDSDQRQGMHYAVMDGEMTVAELRRLVCGAAVCSAVMGSAMIYFSFGKLFCIESVVFFILGACAIVAAMRYTLGRNPYGYRGLGDFYVFIFFGLATTLGAWYLCCHSLDLMYPLLPACTIGLFSIGVLNVNNIRDMKTDIATRKTVAIRLGPKNARTYQTILVGLGWILLAVFLSLNTTDRTQWLCLLSLPLFILHLKGVWTRQDRELDPMLPLLVMSTFLMSLIFLLTTLL